MDKGHMHNSSSGPRHEERDANIPAALWFAAALIIILAVVLGLMKWAFNAFPTPQGEAALSPYAQGVIQELPPEPRLQIHAPEDLKKMREEEISVLSSYGWVDKQNGIVRIPIDLAMEILVRRSTPPRTENAPKPPGK